MYIIKKSLDKTHKSNIFFTILILWLLINIVLFPTTAINGATKGLSTWFNIVVPSLLPFFIISELLINIGFVELIGSLLEPIMMPLFNVPGIGAFPFTLSLISGYPVGVKLVSKLRLENKISKTEAERLLSFSSTSGPLFMLGAVSVGMLKNSSLGPLIVYPHYLASLSLGLLFRHYKKNTNNDNIKENYYISNTNLSIGQLMSNSIKDATNSIISIGGFMILYSVFIEVIYVSRLFNSLIIILANNFPFNISPSVIKGVFAGFIEITIGCHKIASTNISLLWKILIINFFIGWSGLSIHSQALSFLSKTDINSKLYVISKFFHGLLSILYTLLFYKVFYKNLILESFVEETFFPQITSFTQWFNLLTLSFQSLFSLIVGMIILAIIINSLKNFIKN